MHSFKAPMSTYRFISRGIRNRVVNCSLQNIEAPGLQENIIELRLQMVRLLGSRAWHELQNATH